MRFVWLSAAKELTRLRRDPLSLLIPIGIPLIMAVLMNAMFGGGNATPQGRLLVADEDNTIASSVLTGAFGRDPLRKMVHVESVNQTEGRARVDRGEVSALLVIPKGLQAAYLENRPFRLQLISNPSQRILPKMIEETLSMMVDAGFYLQEVAGDTLRTFQAGRPPTDVEIARSSVVMRNLGTKLSKYLNPPLIELETSVMQEKRQTGSFASLFFPGMLFMALMFISNNLATEMWREQMQGTLRRLAMTPAPLGAFLGGRVLFAGMVMLAVTLAGIGAMRWMSVPVASIPAAALWLVFAGTVFFLLLLLLSMHASNRRAANVLGNLVIFPLMLVGGGMFPLELMPAWMAKVGSVTPNGWAVVQFKAILSGLANAQGLAAATAGLLVVGALAFLLALRRLRRFLV
jgi:ABC-type multidrug transport system permease subunit